MLGATGDHAEPPLRCGIAGRGHRWKGHHLRNVSQGLERARWRTRISTRAGRVGALRERKSRVGPRRVQNGQMRESAGDTEPVSATGASQLGQASVASPSSVETPARRLSSRTAAPGINPERSGSASSIPRRTAIGASLEVVVPVSSRA
jgi:hypothetical protein